MVALANIHNGFVLDMSISCCLSTFSPCWVPNKNVVFGGMWALKGTKRQKSGQMGQNI